MASSLTFTQQTKLWQRAVELFEELQKEPESKDSGGHCRRIRCKYNTVVSNLTCVRDIAAMLFEKEMLSERERDDIFSLDPSPTRATEELLNVIMKKDKDVYDGFLKALLDAKQQHIHRLLISEVYECSTSHSSIIRRNYTWLVESLDSSSGLVDILFENDVLSTREMEDIRTETDKFKKNDKLLSLISRKCCDHFNTFLKALIDTDQMHVNLKLQPPPTPPSGLPATRTRSADIPVASSHPPQRTVSVPGPATSPTPPRPPRPQPKQRSIGQIRTVTKTDLCTGKKRTKISSLSQKLSQLSEYQQSGMALKVIAIRQEKNYATSDVLDTCYVNVLRDFDQLTKDTQQINDEKTELRQYLHTFLKRELHINKADETVKLKAEVLNKSMEIRRIKSQTEGDLQRLMAEVRNLQQDIKMERLRSNKTEQENKQLVKDKFALEEMVRKLKAAEVTDQREATEQLVANKNIRFEYKENPTLLKKIEKDTNSKADGLSRLAILENELYVVPLKGHEIEVYDLSTLNIRKRLSLDDDVENVEDIASCDQSKCLYVINWIRGKKLEEILKVDRDGTVLNRWMTSEDQGRLSITHDANVVLTVYTKNKLNVYSPEGRLQLVISLPSNINHPQHAKKLINGNYVVSYGSGFHSDVVHGVCIVDVRGNILKSFCAEVGSSVVSLNHPMYLAIDKRGNILVADLNNSRVLLLSSTLEFQREVVTEKHGLRHPRRICLDDSNGRLIVACGSSKPNETDIGVGQVLLYDVVGT